MSARKRSTTAAVSFPVRGETLALSPMYEKK